MNIKEFQKQHKEWSWFNFGEQPAYFSLLGAVEELGELAHAHLKQEQGIRGTKSEHEEDAKDAVCDVIIFLTDYCNRRGFDLDEILSKTWSEVSKRNWVDFPENGVSK